MVGRVLRLRRQVLCQILAELAGRRSAVVFGVIIVVVVPEEVLETCFCSIQGVEGIHVACGDACTATGRHGGCSARFHLHVEVLFGWNRLRRRAEERREHWRLSDLRDVDAAVIGVSGGSAVLCLAAEELRPLLLLLLLFDVAVAVLTLDLVSSVCSGGSRLCSFGACLDGRLSLHLRSHLLPHLISYPGLCVCIVDSSGEVGNEAVELQMRAERVAKRLVCGEYSLEVLVVVVVAVSRCVGVVQTFPGGEDV